MVIAGIGSRRTPYEVLKAMKEIGAYCREQGIWVRSGHAEGADWYFEQGAQEQCIAYLPSLNFNKQFKSCAYLRVPEFSPELKALAAKHHPKYSTMAPYVQRLMERNGCQVLGEKLNSPVEAVVCYCEWDKVNERWDGGTGQALRIAEAYNIPIINMRDLSTAAGVIRKLSSLRDTLKT